MAEQVQEVVVTNSGQPLVVIVSPHASHFNYETVQQAVTELPGTKTVTIVPVGA